MLDRDISAVSYVIHTLLHTLGIALCQTHLTSGAVGSGNLALNFLNLISGGYEEKHYDDGGAKQGTEYPWS
jgi:hypothetical protein